MDLLKMSLNTAIFILACVIVRTLLKNKLPKTTFFVFWTIVLAKLLVPFDISARVSIFALLERWQRAKVAVVNTNLPAVAPNMMVTAPAKEATFIQFLLANQNWLLALWVVGCCVMALLLLRSYLACRKELKTALPLENGLVAAWLAQHRLKRKILVKVSDKITTPITYGVVTPIVVLPKKMDLKDPELLNCVLTHEWIHIKNLDAVWKFLLALALCLHWFNPLVWAAYKFANRDLELSCDERVMQKLGEAHKSNYAMTLIAMADRSCPLGPCCNGFGKNAIEERIVSIMKFKKTSVIGMALAAVMVLGTSSVFATVAPKNEEAAFPLTASVTTTATVIGDDLATTPKMDESTLLTVEGYTKDIEAAKAELKIQVANGEITQAEADQLIAGMEQTMQDIKDGAKVYAWEKDGISFVMTPAASVESTNGDKANVDGEKAATINVYAQEMHKKVIK